MFRNRDVSAASRMALCGHNSPLWPLREIENGGPRLMKQLQNLWNAEEGQDIAEYAVMLA